MCLCSPRSEAELKGHETFCISVWPTEAYGWKTQGNINNFLYCDTFFWICVCVSNEFSDFPHTSNENDNKEGKSEALTGRLSGETGGEPDTSVGAALKIKDHELMDAYKGAAPQLLNELARLLSQYKWTELGRIPHGIVNILNYSWQDLAAGAVHLNSPEKTESRGYRKSEEARSPQVSADDSREAGGRSSVSENVGDAVRKLQVSANARIKKGKQSHNRGK